MTRGSGGSPHRRVDGAAAGRAGLAAAGAAALVSGVSVFVNSYGVRAFASPTLYTAAKNLVSFVVLGALALFLARRRRRAGAPTTAPAAERASLRLLEWMGLAYVGLVGGGVAFVLFFEGLARTSAAPAAFIKDSLVVLVAVLGVPFLHERPSRWNVAAIGLLVGGEIALSRGIGHLAPSGGNLLVLASTLLWSVEVVVARRLLARVAPATLSLVRMGIGSLALCGYFVLTGAVSALASLRAGQVAWVVLTGVLLSAYVLAWMNALSMARAIDVTSVLVASALVTALFQAAAGLQPIVPELAGLGLVALGTATSLRAVARRASA